MKLTKNILDSQVYVFNQNSHKEYGDGIPYAVHLIYVVSIIQKYLHLLPEEFREPAVMAGWLHDSMEDHGDSYNKIKEKFGEPVAEIVFCVTNESGRTRKEKGEKTYPKTASNRVAVFVKLADRIANVSFGKMTKSSMYLRYCKEHDYFKKVLYLPGEYEEMWNDLTNLISI